MAKSAVVNTRAIDVTYYFEQPCKCKWGISNWESPDPQDWYHLFVLEKAEYERERVDFTDFSASLMSLEFEVRAYLIDRYCQDKKLPLFKEKREK
jgi:hypothetical protein